MMIAISTHDKRVLIAGSAALYTLTPAGDLTPFARGPGGYREDPSAEAYFALSPGQKVASAGCTFGRDDIFILRLHTPIGITRVDKSGEATGSFTNLALPSLNGVAFDTVGSFDHRLIATGSTNGKMQVVAVDCAGATQVITSVAPTLEGGIAVAPTNFGSFGGYLIAPRQTPEFKAAAGEYRNALALRPDSVPVLVSMGDAFLEADQPRGAVEPLEAAARLDPKSARAQLLLGTTYHSLGRIWDAVKAYRRYLELEPAGDFAKDVKAILANLGPAR